MDDCAPSPAGIATADSGRSGPYNPSRDPTVVVLSVIVAGAFLLLVTGTGASLFGGGGGGPVFPLGDGEDDDDPAAVALSIDANRTTLLANGSVSVTVTDGDGDPVENASVSAGDRTVRTDARGNATVRLARAGTVTVRANKAGDGATTYDPATVEVTVDRRRVTLSVSTNASTATVDETVAVAVRRADTGEPVSGSVRVGNRTVEVTDGRATISIDAAGEYTLTATAPETAAERFETATTTLSVERLRRDLTVTLLRSMVLVDRATVVSVRRADTGAGVSATVTVDGRTYETGENGAAVVWGLSAGEYEVRASVDPTPRVAFAPATTVLSVERETVALRVTATSETTARGENVTLRTARADSGAPVDAAVSVAGRTYRTGDDGRVTVAFDRPGNRTIVARKAESRRTRFRSGETTLSVRGAWFRVNGSLDTTVEVGDSYSVAATIWNAGNEPGERTVTYRLTGYAVAERTVSLSPGESTLVVFGPYLTPPLGGAYPHSVVVADDAVTGSLVVRSGNETTSGVGIRTAHLDSQLVSRYVHGISTYCESFERLSTARKMS